MTTLTDSQDKWPFGPAPVRVCRAGGEHDWVLIDLYRAAEPPWPSFRCAMCGYNWSRGWTRAEFRRVILKGAESDAYYGDGSDYPDDPTYAELQSLAM